MLGLSLTPEARPHKIAAVFEQHTTAKAAHHTLIDYGHFDKQDVDIISPDDGEAREKIEPETQAIGQTLIVSHVILGALGAAIGIAAALLMVSGGPLFAQSSPILTVFALGIIGMFFGLFAAGLLSLRPDHDPLINETLAATRENKWAVIVQAKDSGDQQRARQLLQPIAVSVTDTF